MHIILFGRSTSADTTPGVSNETNADRKAAEGSSRRSNSPKHLLAPSNQRGREGCSSVLLLVASVLLLLMSAFFWVVFEVICEKVWVCIHFLVCAMLPRNILDCPGGVVVTCAGVYSYLYMCAMLPMIFARTLAVSHMSRECGV